jgi:hypothetical protein
MAVKIAIVMLVLLALSRQGVLAQMSPAPKYPPVTTIHLPLVQPSAFAMSSISTEGN